MDELRLLLDDLPCDRSAHVAFIVATSACWHESELARPEDADIGNWLVLIRGTKRKRRYRKVPVVSNAQRTLLTFALQHAAGEGGLLFRPWSNVRRDLREACQRAGIAPCSPNDLRRTFAVLLKTLGVPNDLIAPMMGHEDSRMVERVYGRLSTEALAQRVAATIDVSSDRSKYAADSDALIGLDALIGQERRPEVADIADDVVPRGGIEPPTRGFSIHCSTN